MKLFLLAAISAAAACYGAAPRPNILVVVADDWSYPHASAYGTRWVKTPAFDRIAREGVLFSQAYTPVAKCSPSRACLLTGRNPWQLDEAFAHRGFFPVQHRVYPEVLAAGGYFVGFTGKGWAPGVALTAAGGPRPLMGRNFSRHTTKPPTSGLSRNDYGANFAEFLSAATAADAPWCFWFGAMEPHRPYEYGSGIALGGRKPGDIDRVPGYLPDEEAVRTDLLDYALEVEYFDRQLGRMLELLAERGELDRTLIVVTSDNGMPFPRSKSDSYDISNHVPLAIRWPAVTRVPGRVVNDYVSVIDIAPTLLEAAGIAWETGGMSSPTGRSLRPLVAATNEGIVDPTRDHVLIGSERNAPSRPLNQGYPVRGIVTDGWLYRENAAPDRWPAGNPETGYLDADVGVVKSLIIQRRRAAGHDRFWDLAFGKRGAKELYDLRRDPDCLTNLVDEPALKGRVGALHEKLTRALVAQGDPRQAGRPDYFDAFPFSLPGYNGFYERWRAGQAKVPDNVPPSDLEPKPIAP